MNCEQHLGRRNIPATIANVEHVFSLPCLVVALSLIALVSALVLLKTTLSGKSLPGCGPGSACDEVTTSRWSRLGPIPTSLPGAALYLAMLAGAVIVALPNPARTTQHAELARRASSSLVFCSLLAAGGAIWFIALQALVVRRFCRYCMVTHLSALAAAALALSLEKPWQASHGFQGLFIAAAVVLGLFIIGQIAIVPKMYAITQATDDVAPAAEPEAIVSGDSMPPVPSTAESAPRDSAGENTGSPALPPETPGPSVTRDGPEPAQTPTPPPQTSPRRIHAAGDKISLSPHLWPVLGNRDATHIIIDQFDYTCHFCRDLHKLLLKAMAERPADLAILMMPVPMDKACNPMMPATPAEHQDACIYNRYAMAVFRATPERFAEMDAWLFDPARPPALDLVKVKAELLAGGADKLAAAMNDPWMAKRHNEALSIYNAVGQGQLPKLLFAHSVVSGPVPTYEQLLEIFEKVQLFTPPPANPR